MWKLARTPLLLGALAFSLALGALPLEATTGPALASDDHVDPRADELLRRMSENLKLISSFSFDADHTTEVVRRTGEKLAMVATSRVFVQRPDRLRSDRHGEVADLSFFYDGHTAALIDHRTNLYATAAAPPTLDGAIDFARDKLGLEAPASDLLYSDVYRALMEDVVSGSYLGKADIDGVACTHLAFRGREVDWQIWIEATPRALPRRYSITSKDQPGGPEFTVTLRNWSVGAPFPDDTFQFRPPMGAEKIDFLGLRGAVTTKGGAR